MVVVSACLLWAFMVAYLIVPKLPHEMINKIKWFLVLLLLFVGTLFFHHQLELQPSTKNMKSYLMPPIPFIEHFTFGHALIMADLFWLKSIQNADRCEVKVKAAGAQEASSFYSPLEDKKWLFKMLDAITRLDPLYRIVYSLGGAALSVLCEDKEGARLLFLRGIKHFPQNWTLYFKAAYHELYEMEDREGAARLFWEAGRFGAPEWVFLLAQRLLLKEGKKKVLRQFLHQLLKEGYRGKIIEKLKEKILEPEIKPKPQLESQS